MSGLFKMQRKWIKKYIGDDKCVKTNKSITRILEGAFMNCSVITQITIPGIHYIGENAFKDCINLERLSMKNVQKILRSAFEGCEKLSEVHMGKNVNQIKPRAFFGCKNLKSIIIPPQLSAICEETFKGCSSLKAIILPENINSIGPNAFQDCTGLEDVTISNPIISISNNSFKGCTNIKSITIPQKMIDDQSYKKIFKDSLKISEIKPYISIAPKTDVPKPLPSIKKSTPKPPPAINQKTNTVTQTVTHKQVVSKDESFIPELSNAQDVLKAYISTSAAAQISRDEESSRTPASNQIKLIDCAVTGKSKWISAAVERGRICLADKDVKNAFLLLSSAAVGYQSQKKNDAKLSTSMCFVYTELTEMYRLGIGVSEDIEKALISAMHAAELGNSEMAYVAGLLTEIVLKNDKLLTDEMKWVKIFTLYAQAAESGNSDAQRRLYALCYKRGKYNEAINYLSQSASAGDPKANAILADMYCQGIGTTKNCEKAVGFYRFAAKNGVHGAAFKLGKMLYKGDECPKDIPGAEKYLLLASNSGICEADLFLLELYYDELKIDAAYETIIGNGFAKLINQLPESTIGIIYEIATHCYLSEDKVLRLLDIVARYHYKDSEYLLGILLYNCNENIRNYKKAAALLEGFLKKQISFENEAYTRYALGEMYYYGGYGLSKDHNIAYVYYSASRYDNGLSEFKAGKIRYEGSGGADKVFSEAVGLLKTAYNGSHQALRAEAAFMIAEMYRRGDNSLPQSSAKAMKWYIIGANLNHRKSMSTLGSIYFNGSNGKADYVKALYWFEKSGEILPEKELAEAYCCYYGTGKGKDIATAFNTISKYDIQNLRRDFLRILFECYSGGKVTKKEPKSSGICALKLIEKGEKPNHEIFQALALLANILKNSRKSDELLLMGDCLYYLSVNDQNARSKLYGTIVTCQKVGMSQDKVMFKWLDRLAKLNYSPAFADIAKCYSTGTGTQTNPQLAFEYYTKAAENGNDQVLIKLADLYTIGNGCKKDYNKAYKLLTKALTVQQTEAAEGLFKLGRLCMDKDSRLAVNCYRAAYENGISKAGDFFVISKYRFDISSKTGSTEKWDAICNLYKHLTKKPQDADISYALELYEIDECLTAICNEIHRRSRYDNAEDKLFSPNWDPPKEISSIGAEKLYSIAYDLEKYGRTENAILAYYAAALSGDRNALAVLDNMGRRSTQYFFETPKLMKGDSV